MIRAVLRRRPCLQRRGFSGSVGAGPPSSKEAVEAYDEAKYGGWKSATILFTEEPARKPLVARWDWHVVQFLLAMIPPGLALLVVQWARYDMRQADVRREKQALAKESEKLAVVMAHQQQSSPAGQPTSSPTGGTAAAQQTAAGGDVSRRGGEDVQVRLSRLEVLVQQLVEQQAAKVDARLEQEALQRQQAAASAAVTVEGGGAVGQQPEQQQLHAAGEQQQQQQAAAESSQGVQQHAEQAAQDVQQGPRWLLQRAQPAWRWVRARLGGAAPPAALPPTASSQAGRKAGEAAPSNGDGTNTSSVPHGAPQRPGGGGPRGGGAAQPPSEPPAAVAGTARVPGEGTHAAAEPRAPDRRAPPATAAQWLLHSAGAPLRWLRQRDADPPS